MFKFDGWPPLANHWWQAAFYLNLPFEIILILRNDGFGLIVAAFTICITVVDSRRDSRESSRQVVALEARSLALKGPCGYHPVIIVAGSTSAVITNCR